MLVVFGVNQPTTIQIMSKTFKDGDPSFAGSLAGIALGLQSFHILELKDQIPEDVWAREMGLYELAIEDEVQDKIMQIMQEVRQE